jgi:hypothetical protein
MARMRKFIRETSGNPAFALEATVIGCSCPQNEAGELHG